MTEIKILDTQGNDYSHGISIFAKKIKNGIKNSRI
jgi:hypothetical protein